MILVRYLRTRGEIVWCESELSDGSPQLSVRLAKGRAYACVVATGYNRVGWSLCRKGDAFSKKEAVKLAIAEACRISLGQGRELPQSLRSTYVDMTLRSQRYYKHGGQEEK